MNPNEYGATVLSSKVNYKTIPASSTTTSTREQSDNIRYRRRIFENCRLIWLSLDNDECSDDCPDTMAQLRTIISNIDIFTSSEECLDFLTKINDEKIFMIISGTHIEQILPLIHDAQQLDSIYLFCPNNCGYEQLVNEWPKLKNIHTEIVTLHKALQKDLKQYDQDSISISFVLPNNDTFSQNLNQLEPSFMYTQILKEMLLEMEYDERSTQELILYWRSQYANNDRQLNIIAEFERDYTPQSSIWWYTRTYFTYYVLNQALRSLETEPLIKMSFFIRDLHQQIQQLHAQQFGGHHVEPFTVYRGQGLSRSNFEKLMKAKGGLLSFNNFLSTSKKKEVSLLFAEGGLAKPGSVGILFEMTIDPLISSAPFALIDLVSYYKGEQEILFSMHTVFRIGEIKPLDDGKELYRVALKLTNDIDEQLDTLSKRIRQEAMEFDGWKRLGNFLIILRQFGMAEQLYNTLLDQESDENKKGTIYDQLGRIRHGQGRFKKALSYHKHAIEIFEKNVPSSDLDLATSYNNIGSVYMYMKEYFTALSFHEKALVIFEKTLSLDHPKLAISYSHLGAMYESMQEYSKALLFYDRAIAIRHRALPLNHPDLAISYNSIGRIYRKIEENFEAHEILKEALSPNDPNLATTYDEVGDTFLEMGEYSKSLSTHERAFEIRQQSPPPNHPDLASCYGNIGLVYVKVGNYSQALSSHEKALAIQQQSLPPNHPDLVASYNNIGEVYQNMGEYLKALFSYKKALDIQQQSRSPNRPDSGTSYYNIGNMSFNMGDYSKAIFFHEKAYEILRKTLPPNHTNLALSYNNIGVVYDNMGNYSQPRSFYERALEIGRHRLPSNHPFL